MSDLADGSVPDAAPGAASVLDVLRGLRSGTFDPAGLSCDDRRLCVAHLAGEGLSVAEMAHLLGVSTRTVARDQQAIHEQNAIEHDPRLAALFAGRLAAEYEASSSRIRRLARDRETPPAVRMDGEHKCFEMLDRLVQRLQSMGYLPTAAQRVQGDVTHSVGDLGTLADLQREVKRIGEIEADTGSKPAA